MVRNFKRSLTVLVILILAASTYAFAAANTIENSAVGYAANVVGGYTVTSVEYDLAANPIYVTSINFDVANTTAPAFGLQAEVVKIQFKGAGAWVDCTLDPDPVTANVGVVCTLPALTTAAEITALNVVASSTTDP